MSQFSTSTQNPASDKAACRRGVCPPGHLCASCEFPPQPSADGFPHHLVDFELWLRNSHQALSAFGGQFAGYQKEMIAALALIDQFRENAAINLGYDVNTQPTAAPADASGSAGAGAAAAAAPAVPVGNTGTTTTGHGL